MAHLSNFGVGNFRSFKDMYNFELSPITVLTGTNSSGKSSLTKAMLLLKESFTNIKASYNAGSFSINRFDLNSLSVLSFNHHLQLGNFETSKNHQSSDEYIHFNLPFKFPDCIDDFVLTFNTEKITLQENLACFTHLN
ncbi:MAG: AAA family ATPase [Bacteroidetes bacterium]|nr:AAA family ATPase [Bacteroidota bacterium]